MHGHSLIDPSLACLVVGRGTVKRSFIATIVLCKYVNACADVVWGSLRAEMTPCRIIKCSQNESTSRAQRDHRISPAELEKRFQELSAVLQKARDSFSCRLDEDQQNPLVELRTRLFKAKDRFQSRLAMAERFPDPGGFYPVEPENPFQELRSVLRSARVNFVPLLDQYILDNNSSRSSSQGWSSSHSRSDGRGKNPFSGQPPPIENLKLDDDNDVNSFPHRLHWLLEEETRSRRRQLEADLDSRDPVKDAAVASSSPAERLDSLINEELNRKRGPGLDRKNFLWRFRRDHGWSKFRTSGVPICGITTDEIWSPKVFSSPAGCHRDPSPLQIVWSSF